MVRYQRKRVLLPDSDFLDLDFSFTNEPTIRIAILLHGLEGNAQRTYIKGQAQQLLQNGWDVCAVNYRGCSGETNKSYQSYNAGKTDDLELVIQFILDNYNYSQIALIGFSLGGNLLLKYLGEDRLRPKEVVAGVAVSSPLSLQGSLERLTEGRNWIYRTSFLIDLKNKYRLKMKLFPEQMNSRELRQIKSLLDFDNLYTAPAHGFEDAFDYYKQNSSLQFLSNISIPALILNAKNDSFLSENCYPYKFASRSKNIYLETPYHGGHVGFHKTDKAYYSELRAVEFINEKI